MTGRRIGKIETFLVPPRWLFVRVESSDGAVGWGEASLEGWAEAVEGAFEAFRDRFIGVDPFNIEDIWQVGYRGGFYRGGAVLMEFSFAAQLLLQRPHFKAAPRLETLTLRASSRLSPVTLSRCDENSPRPWRPCRERPCATLPRGESRKTGD